MSSCVCVMCVFPKLSQQLEMRRSYYQKAGATLRYSKNQASMIPYMAMSGVADGYLTDGFFWRKYKLNIVDTTGGA